MGSEPELALVGLGKRFPGPAGEVRALEDVELEVAGGEALLLRGPSGAGKSTLLLIAGGMLHPSAGRVRLAGRDLYEMSRAERRELRAQEIGFVFQEMHLLPYLDALANVQLALRGQPRRAARTRAQTALEALGLGARCHHRPGALSAGERQRVALARALVHAPRLLLADEPTGNLDPANADQVRAALTDYRDRGGALLLVTHASAGLSGATREAWLREGRLEDGPPDP